MAGNEPARLELVLVEQFQEPRHAHLAGEHPALDVGGRILAAIGAEPTRDRIDVHAKATKNLFRHSLSPSGSRRPRPYHATHSASEMTLIRIAAARTTAQSKGRAPSSATPDLDIYR